MKRMTILTILLTLTLQLLAPEARTMIIPKPTPIAPYETIWLATCKVESNFDSMAIGDKHLKDKSYGIAQIRKIRLDDYYNRTGIRYSERDMFSVAKSKEIFLYYCVPDMEATARSWNAGPDWRKVKLSEIYYLKIQKALLSL